MKTVEEIIIALKETNIDIKDCYDELGCDYEYAQYRKRVRR